VRLPAALAIMAVTLQVPMQPPRDPGRRPAVEPTGTAAIRGRVVAGDTGSPIAHASVTLVPIAGPELQDSGSATLPGGVIVTAGNQSTTVMTGTVNMNGVPTPFSTAVASGMPRPKTATTDNQGGFGFSNLSPGKYRLRASPAQYSAQYLSIEYGAKKPSGPGSSGPGQPIEIADGQTIGNITIALPRGSVIAGRVTDETGAPLARMQVFPILSTPGNPRGLRVGASMTDDRGQFRLFGLQPGDYVIAAEGRNNTFVSPNAEPQPDQDQIGLLTTYYPGTPNDAEAQRVHVDVGAEMSGVDIRMSSGRLFHVSGNVVNSQGQPVRVNGSLQHRTSGTSFDNFGFSADPQGRFQMQNVPPGDYRLIVREMSMGPRGQDPSAPLPEMASVPLTITTDVDNVFVRLSPGAAITGLIEFDGEQPQLPPGGQPPQIRVNAMPGDPMNQLGVPPPRPAAVNADLTFTLKGILGEYLLRSSAPGASLKSVLLGGGDDITDTPHEFKDGDRVTIVLTTRTSIVQGTVTDDKGAPATDALILMFSQDKAGWRSNSVRTRRGGLTPNGQYKLAQVLPGNYLILAMPRDRLNMPLDPSAFELFAKYATPVVVGDSEQRTADLRLVVPDGGGL
jgi:protocatechuate 3,4-dioxygenase beta subunit